MLDLTGKEDKLRENCRSLYTGPQLTLFVSVAIKHPTESS